MRRYLTILSILILLLGLAACSGGSQTTTNPQQPLMPAIDTGPLVPPSGLSASDEGRRVKLAWDENVTDLAVVGYRVHRTARGQTIALTSDLVHGTRFIDTNPYVGLAVYAVSAVDLDGNESAAALLVHDFQAEDEVQRGLD